MRIDIITIFPGYFEPLRMSLIGKAAARGDILVSVHDLRNWSDGVHHSVDDTPYGGGPGMVMKPEPWGAALDAVAPADPGPVPRLVVPAPSGALFTQQVAARYAGEPRLVFACGRYEGIDARVIDEARTRMPVEEVSIGDYVLAGGEAAVLVMVEAVCRLLPGVLGNAESVADDSFGACGAPAVAAHAGGSDAVVPPAAARARPAATPALPDAAPLLPDATPLLPDATPARPDATPARPDATPALPVAAPALPDTAAARPAAAAPPPGGIGARGRMSPRVGTAPAGGMTGLLEGPVYTKPRVWRGRDVPAVLLSGNHAAIARWRRDAALRRTAQMRPEMVGMLDPAALDDRDREVLFEAGFPVHSEDVAH